MPATTDTSFSDTRLWLLDGARAPKAIITDFKDLKVELNPFLHGTLTVTVPVQSLACTALDASSATAISTDWGWKDANANGVWSLDFYYRATRVFSGPVVIASRERQAHSGTAYVTLVAENFYQHLMRRRQVRTETGSQRTDTDDISDVFRELVRENCETGNIVTPTASGYRQAYPATESRDDFGSFTVTVEADDHAGSSVTWVTDDKTNLLDTLDELCLTESSDADWLWPTLTETSAGTFRVGVLCGRSGGSRGIGDSYTDSIVFSSGRRNVPRFARTSDYTASANVWTVTGKGRGASQFCRHIVGATAADYVGVIEDALNVPQGGTTDELDKEAQRLINEQAAGWIVDEVEVYETDECTYPADFDIGDNISVYDDTFGVTSTQMVIGVRIDIPTPGPSKLTLKFGRIRRNPLREMQRSGGGGGGGRGGGGRPRGKTGDSTKDPDLIWYWNTIKHNDNSDLTADEDDDNLAVLGETGSSYLRDYTTSTDPGTGAAGVEVSEHTIHFTPQPHDDLTYDAIMIVRGDDGYEYHFHCEQKALAAAAAHTVPS